MFTARPLAINIRDADSVREQYAAIVQKMNASLLAFEEVSAEEQAFRDEHMDRFNRDLRCALFDRDIIVRWRDDAVYGGWIPKE
jgi:hypothetical protein